MLSGSKPPDALGDYTGFLLNWCAARSRSNFAGELERLGLKPQEFAVLSVIAAHPGFTQQALVDATGVDPSTMVQMLDALQEAGLAERRPHPTDRRKRAVHLTPAGARLLTRGKAAARQVGDQVFARLSAEERRELHRLLRKLSGLE